MTFRSILERCTLVFVVLFFAGGAFLFDLYRKQVLEHTKYAEAAAAQSTSTDTTPADRGQIIVKDKDGNVYTLATNVWQYQLLLVPSQIKQPEKLLSALKQDLPDLKTDEILQKLKTNSVYLPPVMKGIAADKAQTISDKNYVGVYMQPQTVRVYPESDKIAAQVLGFVGSDGVGKYGVEAIYNGTLSGEAGTQTAKRDSVGRLIDILGGTQSEPGSDLILTLDYNLQYYVEGKLSEAVKNYQADSGQVIVMDPKTGAILAVAGQPTFDPNNYGALSGDEQRRFLMPAASDSYEAGSVVKPLTMAIAIDLGLVTPETTGDFGKTAKVGDKEIGNALGEAFGHETMTQVLQNSDNVAMTWISGLLGAQKEREYLDKYGFGKKTGVEVTGEQTGILPALKSWNDILTANAAFGQGFSMTLTQLAQAYSVIANGGTTVTPHLVSQVKTGDSVKSTTFPAGTQVVSADTAAKLRQMLVAVVELGNGKKAKVAGIQVGGKTGTAQVPDPVKGGYYTDRSIGTFVGMFPADNPKYVMAVRLDNPKTVKFAESSAAPTFGEIANWMTTYFQLR